MPTVRICGLIVSAGLGDELEFGGLLPQYGVLEALGDDQQRAGVAVVDQLKPFGTIALLHGDEIGHLLASE